MGDISLLNKRKFVINDKITIHIPTIREIRGDSYLDGINTDEADYYSLINLFSVTSTDIMLELHKQGIDFTQVSDYTTFLMMFSNIPDTVMQSKSHLLFENINFADFTISINPENQEPVLYDATHDIVIDEMLYMRMSTVFCTINRLKKNKRKMGNETMKQYAIEREEQHRKHRKKKPSGYESRLDKYIIALVNDCNFKYNFDTVNDLTIYDFNVSMQQIIKKYQVKNTNMGMYMGTISLKGMSDEAKQRMLDWLDYESYTPSKKALPDNNMQVKTNYSAKKKSEQQ